MSHCACQPVTVIDFSLCVTHDYNLVEEQTVCVKFVEDEGSETYDIQWVELLSEDNIPFISFEELNSDDSFLAPYLLTNGQTAYAPAVLVTGTGIVYTG